MNSVYPMEEKPIAPPTYEQATYYPQAPPIPTMFGMYSTSATVLTPQAPPVGTDPTTAKISPSPAGMYPTNATILPPPAGMYPTNATILPPHAPPIGTHMLITTQSLIYGDIPIQCTCPHCYQPIVTRVEKTPGIVTWVVCGGILLLGCWLGCCLIPFCMDSLKDTEHYCPNCAAFLGTRRRM